LCKKFLHALQQPYGIQFILNNSYDFVVLFDEQMVDFVREGFLGNSLEFRNRHVFRYLLLSEVFFFLLYPSKVDIIQ